MRKEPLIFKVDDQNKTKQNKHVFERCFCCVDSATYAIGPRSLTYDSFKSYYTILLEPY